MNMTLKQIKRFIIQEKYVFTLKAESKPEADGLIIEDALESILNADDMYKVLNRALVLLRLILHSSIIRGSRNNLVHK